MGHHANARSQRITNRSHLNLASLATRTRRLAVKPSASSSRPGRPGTALAAPGAVGGTRTTVPEVSYSRQPSPSQNTHGRIPVPFHSAQAPITRQTGTRRRLLVHIGVGQTAAARRLRGLHARLGPTARECYTYWASAGRVTARLWREEGPSSTRAARWVTPRRGQPDGKWHRNIPPASAGKGEMVG